MQAMSHTWPALQEGDTDTMNYVCYEATRQVTEMAKATGSGEESIRVPLLITGQLRYIHYLASQLTLLEYLPRD